jgi:hypothetical protein
MKQVLKELLISFCQRKMIYLFYSLIEKWVMLIMFSELITLSNNIFYFIILRDILALILFSVISFEKIKIHVGKNI